MSAEEQGIDGASEHWQVVPRTVCFLTNDDDVLLLKRASHRRIFPNKYTGVGGHIERDEDPFHGALREIDEEAGLPVQNLLLCGVVNIAASVSTGVMLFIFRAEALARDFKDCDEGQLQWVPQDDVMAYDLVEDMPLLLPRVLAMETGHPPFFVHSSYDDHGKMRLRFADENKGVG